MKLNIRDMEYGHLSHNCTRNILTIPESNIKPETLQKMLSEILHCRSEILSEVSQDLFGFILVYDFYNKVIVCVDHNFDEYMLPRLEYIDGTPPFLHIDCALSSL